uniref:RabBD domain-containing protein n=1 Tax=Romanomermis culicivorax TaxID=13658 RepID=A0A915INE1_ROMCU
MNYDPTNEMAAPDLSHLTEEERKIIEEVMKRQNAEENSEKRMREQHEKELKEIEKLIEERRTSILNVQATMDPALCQICQKTKFADGIGRKCVHCQLKQVSWACQLCSKRQELLSKSGIWFQNRRQLPADHPPPLQKSLQPSSTTTTPPAFSPIAAATPSVETTPSKKLDRKYSTDWAKSLKEPHQCYEDDHRHVTLSDIKKKSPDEKNVTASTSTSTVATTKTGKVEATPKDETVASRMADNTDDRQVENGVEAPNGLKTEVSKPHDPSCKVSSPETMKYPRNGPSTSMSPRFPDYKLGDTAGIELEQHKVPFRDNGANGKNIVVNERLDLDRLDVHPIDQTLPNGPFRQSFKTPSSPPSPTSVENESNNYDKEKENNKIENAESKKQQQNGAPRRALYQKRSLNDCASNQAFLKHEEKRAEKSYCQRVINNSSSSSSSLEDEHLYRRSKVDQARKKSDPKGRKEQVHRKTDTLSERTDFKNDQVTHNRIFVLVT